MLRKRAHYFIILLLLLTSFSGSASEELNKQDKKPDWNEYFAGPRSYPVITRPWSSYLKVNHQLCDFWATQMDILVKDYDQAAYDGRADEANVTYEKIYDILFRQLGEGHPCFAAAAQSYAVNSLFWLDNINFSAESKSHDSNRGLPDHPDKALLFAALMNKGFVTLLTPATRVKLGEAWSLMADSQKPEILGAYDCGSSVVSFDIFQRPLDLGATIVHELDHLTRDKLLSTPLPERLEADLISAQKQVEKMSWANLILLDESLAVSYASTVQLRYRLSPRFVELKDDLNFSNKNGPVLHMWQKTKAALDLREKPHLFTKSHFRFVQDNRPPAEMNEGGVNDFFEKNFLSNEDPWAFSLGVKFDEQSILKNTYKQNVQNVTPFYRLIYKSYFLDDTPYQISSELDPNWLSSRFSVLSNLTTFQSDVTVYSLDSALKSFASSEYLPGVLKHLAPLLDKPSSMCRGFKKALSSEQLNNYVGAVLSGVHKTEKGVKGSLFAVKTEKGVKGGLFSVKTEKGVKGERSTVRPCLNLGSQL